MLICTIKKIKKFKHTHTTSFYYSISTTMKQHKSHTPTTLDTKQTTLDTTLPKHTTHSPVSHYNSSTVCGAVWSTDFIAYRCRTCGKSPCMSLCPSCFEPEKHEGINNIMIKLVFYQGVIRLILIMIVRFKMMII